MKKVFCLLLCCLLAIVCAGCGGSGKGEVFGGYKQYAWGTPIDQIIATEGKPVSVDEKIVPASSLISEMRFTDVTYRVNEYGQNFNLVYEFQDGELWRVEYSMYQNGDASSFTEAYNAVKKGLTKEFGKPYMDEGNWIEESERDKALERGYSEYKVVVYNPPEVTQITLTAGFGDSGDYYITIEYIDCK